MAWRFLVNDLEVALERDRCWRPYVMTVSGIPVDVSPATDWFSPFRVWVAPIEIEAGRTAVLEIVARDAGFCRTLYQATLDGQFVGSNKPWSLPLPNWSEREETERMGYLRFFWLYAWPLSVVLLGLCVLWGVVTMFRFPIEPNELARLVLLVELVGLGFSLVWSWVRWRNFVDVNRRRRSKLRAHFAAA